MSARDETLEGIDPEERAWLASYLDVFAKKYAHELAEKQRAVVADRPVDDLMRIFFRGAANVIDPEVLNSGKGEAVRPA